MSVTDSLMVLAGSHWVSQEGATGTPGPCPDVRTTAAVQCQEPYRRQSGHFYQSR